MRVVAHGIDIVECRRIERIWHDHGERFLRRIYTADERDYCLGCRTPVARLAGRFAAKEAILKALGTGLRGPLAWTDMEILPDGFGRPHVALSGGCAAEAARIGVAAVLVSISHTAEYAAASVIGVSG